MIHSKYRIISISVVTATFLISLFCGQIAFAQGQKGLNYIIGFDYNLRPVSPKLTSRNSGKSITFSNVIHSYKIKGGITFLTYNILYMGIEVQAGGISDVSTTKFTSDTKIKKFDYDLKAQGFFVGYQAYFGKQTKRNYNFYGGAEFASTNYSTQYGGGGIFHKHKINASTSSVNLFLGANYLLGSADFHLELIFSDNKGIDKKTIDVDYKHTDTKNPSNNVTYKDTFTNTTDLGGISLSFGILKYM
ncbi:MAG: hypothetical protein JJV97_02450 [SAR324 cluster bacterium]|nr:hypothetical protein [SAR324 cluster bacterium]